MALKENQPVVDPHAQKKARWNDVVTDAKALYPMILSGALPSIKARLDKNPPQNDEDARAAKKMEFERAAENAFLVAQAFTSVRKKERGRYMADE